MKEKYLQDVISDILETNGEGLSLREITDIISVDKLWRRPSDQKIPTSNQVTARINKYPHLFVKENGVVSLRKKDEKQMRVCKIVWNINDWITPSVRRWDRKYITNKTKGYEQKHGFVHEDWLFNSQFHIDGYQYGYIQGIGKLNSSIKTLEIVYLFTINPNTKERFYVGKLHNVETIQPEEIINPVKRAVVSYHTDMINQLKIIGADYLALNKDPYLPNLRFKIETMNLFPIPLPIINSWFDKKYFRTMPMKLNDKLLSLFDHLEKDVKFKFVPSSPFGKKLIYEKHLKKGQTSVTKVHQEMEEALYSYLLKKGVRKSNIACDTVSFGGKLADIVVRIQKNSFEIYEIKTDSDLRRSLRTAVGQLIDYSTWEKGINVNNIHAVVPETNLSQNLKDFVQRVKSKLNFDFGVLLYNKNSKSFEGI